MKNFEQLRQLFDDNIISKDEETEQKTNIHLTFKTLY